MFCTKCGNQLKENQKFCSKCGNRVSNQNFVKETMGESTNSSSEGSNNLFDGYEELLKSKNNNIFTELFHPSGRRNRSKYIIFLILAFFAFYLVEWKIDPRTTSEFLKILKMVLRLLLVYIIFVNLSKRFHDFNQATWLAVPVLIFSYVFFYVVPPILIREMVMTFEIGFYTVLLRACLILTVLPHVLVSFIKGTDGGNQYGYKE